MAIAGSTVDALEPNASEAMREKAVLMLADEYLGKSATPNLASDARKRAQNRRSRTLVRRPGDPAPSQSKIPSTPFSHPQQQPLRQQPSQSQPFYPQHNQPIYRKSPGPVNSASPIPPLNATNSPRLRSLSRETPKRTNSSQKQRRPSAGGDPSTSLSTDRRNSISSLNEDSILQPQPQNPPLSPAPSSSSYNPRQFEVVSPAPYISRSTSNSGNSSQHQKGGPNSTPPQFRRKKSFEGGGIDYIDDSTQSDMNRSEVGVGRSEVGRSNSLKALHQQQLQQQQLQQQQQQQQNSPQRHAMPIQMQQQIQNRYRELGSGGPGDRGSPSFGYLQQQQRSGYRSDEQGQGQGQGTQRGQSLSRNSSRK
ncbi:hypothetical protein HDU99_004360 [Rhizoclosmatium hyalinum]|nr:hypothetical protein HDU99_004360 [Rhizoclosmatium hyalinum]